tara:strand:- start:269 stop:478 length:210 start_codon:yes stop_codon:yes gene_type:complete
MTQTPRRVIDDLVRVACEAIEQLEKEHEQMNINCTMLVTDLSDRFEECLEDLDKHSVDGGYVKCFGKPN